MLGFVGQHAASRSRTGLRISRTRKDHERFRTRQLMRVTLISPTLHGTGIFTYTLGWCQRGQWGGIYGSPMECLGVVSWRRRRATSPLRVLIRSLGRLPSRSLMRRQISQCLGWGVRDSIGFFQPGQWDSAPEDHRRLGACRKCPEFLKKTSGVLSRLANVMHGMPICCMLHA